MRAIFQVNRVMKAGVLLNNAPITEKMTGFIERMSCFLSHASPFLNTKSLPDKIWVLIWKATSEIATLKEIYQIMLQEENLEMLESIRGQINFEIATVNESMRSTEKVLDMAIQFIDDGPTILSQFSNTPKSDQSVKIISFSPTAKQC